MKYCNNFLEVLRVQGSYGHIPIRGYEHSLNSPQYIYNNITKDSTIEQ